jgi:hypothetical protein
MIDNYKYLTSLEKLKALLSFKDFSSSLFFSVLTILIIISFTSLLIITKISLNEKHQFDGICKTEDNLLNYVVTYLVPILSIDINESSSLMVNSGLFLLLGFIYVKNSLVYLNPLFLFFKYNIFRTENNEILISNYDIYDLKGLEGTKVKARVLSYKIYLIRKQKRHP